MAVYDFRRKQTRLVRAGDSVTVTLEFTGAGGSPDFQARVVPLDSLEMSLANPSANALASSTVATG